MRSSSYVAIVTSWLSKNLRSLLFYPFFIWHRTIIAELPFIDNGFSRGLFGLQRAYLSLFCSLVVWFRTFRGHLMYRLSTQIHGSLSWTTSHCRFSRMLIAAWPILPRGSSKLNALYGFRCSSYHQFRGWKCLAETPYGRLGNVLNHSTLVHEPQRLIPKNAFLGCLISSVNPRGVEILNMGGWPTYFCNLIEKRKRFQASTPGLGTHNWDPGAASCADEFRSLFTWIAEIMASLFTSLL